MATTDRIAAEDDAQVQAYRAKFGDDKAAEFAADLYKLRRTPAPAPETPIFGVFPRWTLVLIAMWLALLETADKLPRLLLAVPGYEATLAELQAKMMQPDITAAQLAKAQNEAKASTYQPNLAAVQLDKNSNEAKASIYQPKLAAVQLEKNSYEAAATAYAPAKAQNEAKASTYQPNLAAVQLEKNTYEANATAYAPAKALSEAKAAQWQPALAAAQGYDTQMKWLAGVPNDSWKESGNLAIADERPTASDMAVLRASKPVLPSPGDAAASSVIGDMKNQGMVNGLRILNRFSSIGTSDSQPTTTAATEPTPPATSRPTPTPTFASSIPTAPPSASLTGSPLRTPAAFDCAKASMGVDYVICASPELMDAEARLEEALHAAHSARAQVMTEQWAWIKRYGDCGLPATGRPSATLIQGTSYCVGRAIEARIKELLAER